MWNDRRWRATDTHMPERITDQHTHYAATAGLVQTDARQLANGAARRARVAAQATLRGIRREREFFFLQKNAVDGIVVSVEILRASSIVRSGIEISALHAQGIVFVPFVFS